MREFTVYEQTHIDANGRKVRKRVIGSVEARNIRSAVNKVKKLFKRDPSGVRYPAGALLVVGRNPKTHVYDEWPV